MAYMAVDLSSLPAISAALDLLDEMRQPVSSLVSAPRQDARAEVTFIRLALDVVEYELVAVEKA
ncbi:unnamed protein product [Urochloa humidicola]